jgi:serine protease Do
LLVVFRCVPCEACAQLDQRIVERDPRIQALLNNYVCVRVVHANGMDLRLFQFDYDQSFAAFIMNGDKTIYGRYGTRSHQKHSEDDVSLEGFAEALEAGLKIHADYPGNQAELAAKQPGSQPQFSTPEQFPKLGRFKSKLDYEGKVASSCIHCHQVGETLRDRPRDEGKPVPDELIFPYPHPKILGLIMDPKHAATIAQVAANSPADRDGFRTGDELLTLDGQPLTSLADMQWVLHNATKQDAIPVSLRRNGQAKELSLTLGTGWRKRGDLSWRATSWDLRRMTLGGMRLDEASPELRTKSSLTSDALALVVSHLGQFGEHAHAKNQGFQKGDLIVSIDGDSKPARETDLFALLINKPVGTKVPVSVLRGTERLPFTLVMQK